MNNFFRLNNINLCSATTFTLVCHIFSATLGCANMQMIQSGNELPTTGPSIEEYFDGYLLGLIHRPSLNVDKACVDQQFIAAQQATSTEDFLIGLLTLGIYTPSTLRVWCVDKPGLRVEL